MRSRISLFMARAAVAVLSLSVCAPAVSQSAVDLNNAGTEHYNRGDFLRATTLLERALDLAPENGTVRRNLCNARQGLADQHAKEGDIRTALRLTESAMEADPSNASPLIQAGAYYLRLDDVGRAIERLEKAIVTKPGDLDAHELLGQAYYRDNDLSSARAQWDYVLEVDPSRPHLRERYDKAFREESVESDFNRWKSRHFRVSYPDDIPDTLRGRVVSILDKAYVDVGRALGGVYPPPPIQAILYTGGQFSEATQLGEHVGAVYDGKIRAPMTDPSGNWLPDEEIRRRLVHEYVHVVVRNITGDKVPWWANEGLAEYLSHSLDQRDRERLRALYGEGRDFRLASLSPPQLAGKLSPERLKEAYLQAHATMDLLMTRHGKGKVQLLLMRFAAGDTEDRALRQVYRKTLETLEEDVRAAYR
ncbi:MAG TPA: tetratricopeptide repeat protein [Candidatus Hydrogenedentes bacterium]|nr:tetratricopeptide repeat protein [Candidatus Hydrogenedentota bacterium]